MGELFSVWRFALRRFAANWPLMLLVGAGAVLAPTLLAAAPIYTDTMSDIGLRFRLERELEEPRERAVSLYVDRLRLGDPVQLAQSRAFHAISEARVGWLGPELLVEHRSDTLGVGFVSASDGGERRPWPGRLIHLSGYEDHVEVVEGRLPAQDAATAEVVLPDGFQREAAVGDRLVLTARRYDDCRFVPPSEDEEVAADEVMCRPTTFVSAGLQAEIVGFVRPGDPDDLRWQLFQDGWTVPEAPPQGRGGPIDGSGGMPLLTSGEYFTGALTTQLQELLSRYRAGVVPDLEGLAVRDVTRALDDLAIWRSDLRDGLGLAVGGRLEFAEALAQFRNASTFSQIPLLLLLLQVAGVVAFYIVVLTALARDRQAQEVAVYRSRGASTAQLLGLTLAEGLLIAVPAALLGPPLAVLAVSALGYTPAFAEITGGEALPASFSEDALLLAFGGAVLALVAMLLPAIGIVRRAIVDAKREQARPPERGWFRRYHLDLGLVVLALLLFWQLERRGAVFDPQSVGGWQADPLLLLSPLVMTAAAAALVLRLYSPLLRLIAWLLRPLRGTAVTLGIGRAGRDPAASARLLLLVSTAVAVGAFAASYAPTVDRSFEDRARYDHGVDLRAGVGDFRMPRAGEGLERLRAVEGVEQAIVAHRGRAGLLGGGAVELLAIDDLETAAPMLWFREDFADEPPERLLSRLDLGVPLEGGIPLPDDTVALEIDAYTEISPRIGRLRAWIREGDGDYREFVFSAPEPKSWTVLEVGLLWRSTPLVDPPLTLAGIRFNDRRLLVTNDGALFLDNVTAVRSNGERVVVEDFEDEFSWTMFSQRGSSETFGASDELVRSGEQAARWTWTREVGERSRVLAPSNPALPLNAIFSESALAHFGVQPGDRTVALLGDGFQVPLIVRGTARLFPTLDPAGFIVVDYEQLRTVAGALGSTLEQQPTELWIDFAADLTLAEQEAIFELALDPEWMGFVVGDEPLVLADRLGEIAADPTLQASGGGILLLAFAGAMGAALLGFVVSLAITLRARTVEVAVLRSLGASRRELLRAFVFEWGVVLLFGALIGVLLGRWISQLMLQFLEVTEAGTPVVPEFSVQTEWSLLSIGVALLILAAALTLWDTWRAVLRRAGAAALRLTQ
ncbi:MAG: FtsX-like permease family protein [Chloroflexi bacterium]|nr:FtsX-like permease family protein [Chloroflexota bacterium]